MGMLTGVYSSSARDREGETTCTDNSIYCCARFLTGARAPPGIAGEDWSMIFRVMILSLGVLLATVAVVTRRTEAVQPQNVLVLYNSDQDNSDSDDGWGPGRRIAEYYQQQHPGVHLAGLSGIDALLFGPTSEQISAGNYLDVIRPQILTAIGGISIDVIVTTKGLPLVIDAGADPGKHRDWRRYSSLESELTRVDSIDTVEEMGDQHVWAYAFPIPDTGLPGNPYYNTNAPFVREGSDPINGDIRLSARLDGYNVETIKAAIDKAQNAFVVRNTTTPRQYLVLDDDPTADTDQMVNNAGTGPGLRAVLDSKDQAYVYENTDSAITTAPAPVVGYVSHGANDGDDGLEAGYVTNQLDFTLADGAVFLTHESFNAYSFDPTHTQTQGLVAEWLEIGGTAGLGHVREPYNGADNVTNEDLLFDMLLPGNSPTGMGLTFVEAAWNATRQLSYVNTVVGDPLMVFRELISGDANKDGIVNIVDLGRLATNWDTTGEPGGAMWGQGDFNLDGFINIVDLGILATYWEQTSGWYSSSGAFGEEFGAVVEQFPEIEANPIPEPAALVSLWVGTFCLLGRGSESRKSRKAGRK